MRAVYDSTVGGSVAALPATPVAGSVDGAAGGSTRAQATRQVATAAYGKSRLVFLIMKGSPDVSSGC